MSLILKNSLSSLSFSLLLHQETYDQLVTMPRKTSFDKRDWYFQGGHTKFTKAERDRFTLDEEGLYSTTHADDAEHICKIIAELPKISKEFLHRRPVITDACACGGGNAISFLCSELFEHVNVVELNSDRCSQHLRPNLAHVVSFRHPTTTYDVLNEDYLAIYQSLKQDVVFMDPPWGGTSYRQNVDIDLFLNNISVCDLSLDLVNKYCKYVVLKLPLNFDCKKLNASAASLNCACIWHTLKKYYIAIVCEQSKPSV